jgi:UDPglucose 6-dehydrogenase|tara:strand:- start:26 stop:1207 length:1182 start_codon:yes stop_codon:yes gene_type:complete
MISTVAMIGLGKLGMPVAECMTKQYTVKGYDILPKQSDKIKIKSTLKETCKDSEIIFIAMPTPHDERYGGEKPMPRMKKDFDYTALEQCLHDIESIIANGVLVVLISTVLPGTYRRLAKKYNGIQNLIYNPSMIAMGTVADDFLNPDLAIFGYSKWTHGVGMPDNHRNAKRLIWFYERLWERRPFIAHGTYEEAECIKIFHNTYVSTKIGIANMLGDVAHKIDNCNVDAVTNALKHADRVVGPRYMTAGNGDGGPCHPRDNIALSWFADKIGLGYDLFGDIMRIREKQAENIATLLCSFNRDVVIVGKSFKPESNLTDGSASMLIGYYCEQMNRSVTYEKAPSPTQKYTYLLAHPGDYTNYYFNDYSIIVDLHRQYTNDSYTVIHYGSTNTVK